MAHHESGIVWLNVCIAVGMCLCTFFGGLTVRCEVMDYNFTFPAANILFAFMTFPATDILTEIYGKKVANRAVWVGYASQATTVLLIRFMLLFPGDTSLIEPFAQSGSMVFIASTVAYLSAQFWDITVFHYIKDEITGPSHLWLRNNLSTMSSQLINSVIFISMVFGIDKLLPLLAGSIVVKFTAAIIDTPFVYLGCFLLRRKQSQIVANVQA